MQLLAPVEASAQTGGPKEAGVVHQRASAVSAPTREPKKVDTSTMLQRIRVSYPALRATKVDSAFRQLMLSEMITQVYNEGGAIVIPQGARLQPVSEEKFTEYKAALSGLTE